MKALCVATRCLNVDQFIATYHPFCDETSFFVATQTTRPIGLETAFSIQLSDNTPVLRGLCTVAEAWTTSANPFKRPGIRLAIRRLTPDSVDVFGRLTAARAARAEVRRTTTQTLDPVRVADISTGVPTVQIPPVREVTAPRVSPPAVGRVPTQPIPKPIGTVARGDGDDAAAGAPGLPPPPRSS
ncbi:MAG: hypothetical protein KIT31_13725, partial [Deltaproteobacteria bacterium]|nr:hypothetical protein [Deltaproteobacteria bacterium]